MSFCASVVMCKCNYATTVQKIMPGTVRSGRLAERAESASAMSYTRHFMRTGFRNKSHLNRELGLTALFIYHIIMFTYKRCNRGLYG